MFAKIVEVIPKLKTTINLIGFIVMIGAFVAVYSVNPENLQAQISAGAIGVTIIVFGQIFHFLNLIPEAQRAIYIVVMFLIFVVFASGLVYLTASLLNQTEIRSVTLNSIHQGNIISPNTFDDLDVSWNASGADQEIEIRLFDPITNTRSNSYTARSGDQRVMIPASLVSGFWAQSGLRDEYQASVEIGWSNSSARSKVTIVQRALELFYYLENNEVRLYSSFANNRTNDHFEAKCVVWPKTSSESEIEPLSTDVRVTNGGGSSTYIAASDLDPDTLKCVYLGPDISKIVREGF